MLLLTKEHTPPFVFRETHSFRTHPNKSCTPGPRPTTYAPGASSRGTTTRSTIWPPVQSPEHEPSTSSVLPPASILCTSGHVSTHGGLKLTQFAPRPSPRQPPLQVPPPPSPQSILGMGFFAQVEPTGFCADPRHGSSKHRCVAYTIYRAGLSSQVPPAAGRRSTREEARSHGASIDPGAGNGKPCAVVPLQLLRAAIKLERVVDEASLGQRLTRGAEAILVAASVIETDPPPRGGGGGTQELTRGFS